MPLLVDRKLRLLHVSDLHLKPDDVGGDHAPHTRWTDFVRAAKARGYDLCLLTGDLAKDSPDRALYERLKNSLSSSFKAWKVVPGNHDRKLWGNFGRNEAPFDEVFEGWRGPWKEQGVPLIVIPIDSNPTERLRFAFDFARGHVSRSELARIGDVLASVRDEIKTNYQLEISALQADELLRYAVTFMSALTLQEMRAFINGMGGAPPPAPLIAVLVDAFMARAVRLVLIHHHPVGVADTENLGMTHQDAYLSLVNSGEFIRTLREHAVSIVCHGHKHMPHRMALTLPGEDDEQLGVVGCGSTTAPGKHASDSANEISISEDGEVDVRLIRLGKEEWKQSPSSLKLRSWSNIKRHLSTIGDRHSLVTAASVSFRCDVLPTGDAVLTQVFRGVQFTDGARGPDGMVHFPISLFASGSLLEPEVNARAVGDVNIGKADTVSLQSGPGHGSWLGYARIHVPPVDGLKIDLAVRSVAHCAFATAPWRFAALYGFAVGHRLEEKYGIGVRVPVRERLLLSVRSDDPSLEFAYPEATYGNHAGLEDRSEMRSLTVEMSPMASELMLLAERPVWGSSYGLHWRWKGMEGDLRKAFGNFPRRKALERRLSEHGEIVTSERVIRLERLLAHVLDPLGLEGSVFLVLMATEAAGARLVQLARNRLVIEREMGERTFPFGVGVVGRAAWVGRPIAWVREQILGGSGRNGERSAARREMIRMTDYYAGDRSEHHAVLAIPLFLGEPSPDECPLAVLSIASREEGDAFTRLVESLSLGSTTATRGVDGPGRVDYSLDVNTFAGEVRRLVID